MIFAVDLKSNFIYLCILNNWLQTAVLLSISIIKQCELLTLGDDVISLRLHMYQFVLDLVGLANRGAALLYRLLRVSSLSFNLTR